MDTNTDKILNFKLRTISMKKDNIILEKTFDFALSIIELYKKMTEQKEYVLSKQILRSGTSIGANIEEAIAAHSRKDFAAKMILASKEARETRYWLRLLQKSQLVKLEFTTQLNDIETIINIIKNLKFLPC